MKKIFVFMLAFVSFLCAELDFNSYFTLKQNLNVLDFKNPFFHEQTSASNSLHLQAIFNDRAKINERWYQKDDTVGGAKIIEISQKQGFVLLEKEEDRFYLKLKRVSHKVFIE